MPLCRLQQVVSQARFWNVFHYEDVVYVIVRGEMAAPPGARAMKRPLVS